MAVITGKAVAGSPATLMARACNSSGTPLTQSMVSSIAGTIADVTAGGTPQALTVVVATAISNTLQPWPNSLPDAVGYNFSFIVPPLYLAIPTHCYFVQFTITLSDATVTTLEFELELQPVVSPYPVSADLSINYQQLRAEVSRYLGLTRDQNRVGLTEAVDIDEFVRSGLRQFYWPPPIDVQFQESLNRTRFSKENPASTLTTVRWSFLSPKSRLVCTAGTAIYPLPVDFGGHASAFTYEDGQGAPPLTPISDPHIRALHEANAQNGRPAYYAVRPLAATGQANQTWEIVLYPKPDSAYQLAYRYDVTPPMISEANPYPLGGPAHAETILESCLAVAEERTLDESQVHRQRFMVLLGASAQFDSQMVSEDAANTWPVGQQTPTTLDVQYADLLRHVGHFLDYGWDASKWTRDQMAVVDDLIQSGVRSFYRPAMVPDNDPNAQYKPARPSHRWSFLIITDTMPVTAGLDTYELTSAFSGELIDDLTYAAGSDQVHIKLVSDDMIRDLKSDNNAFGPPQYVSLRAVPTAGLRRQVWQAVFYPTPDAAYSLSFQYVAAQPRLSAANPFPLGGVDHAETVLAACLAAAEERLKPESQSCRQRFQARLLASIAADSKGSPTEAVWPVGDAGAQTLDVTYDQLVKRVGHELGIGWVPGTWSVEERQRVEMAIQGGIRQFCNPPPLGGERYGYEWSFLRPLATLTTVAGQTTYDLPDDFAAIDGPMTFDPGMQTLYTPVKIVDERQIRTLLSVYSYTFRPDKAAIRPKAIDETTWTRYEIIFFPTPDDSYCLTYKYRVNLLALSKGNQYPPGAQPHAETILESCLAAAEAMRDGKPGLHAAKYAERLVASVSVDRKASAPEFLGYNSDLSDRPWLAGPYGLYGTHWLSDNLVTYNGVVPG